MPYRFEYEPHHGILLGTVEGEVADPLIREFSRIGDAIVVRKGARVAVADLSAVTTFQVSTKTIHELAGSLACPVLRARVSSSPRRPMCLAWRGCSRCWPATTGRRCRWCVPWARCTPRWECRRFTSPRWTWPTSSKAGRAIGPSSAASACAEPRRGAPAPNLESRSL